MIDRHLKQPDLFLSETQPDLLEDRPERAYRADPDDVRARLQDILAEARAAQAMPWEPSTLSLYRTIFPQMTNWLPEEEAARFRFEFETELVRLRGTPHPDADSV